MYTDTLKQGKQTKPEDLGKLVDTCKKYLTHENLSEMAPTAKLALYTMAVETIEESQRGPAYAVLAGEYAKMADSESNIGHHAAADVYGMIAAHYLKLSGIGLPEAGEGQGKQGIHKYLQSIQDKGDYRGD